MKFRFALFLLPLFSTLFAQETVPYYDFDDIIKGAAEAGAEEKYHKAYLEFNSVNKNDSNYIGSLISQAYYLLVDEELDSTRYDDVVKIMDEGINDPDVTSKLNYYINKSVALNQQKKYKEALKTYDAALSIYPNNSNLYYRKGLAYENLKEFENAAKMYKKAIILNPYEPKSHLKLGGLCYRNNKITQALMCMNFYLLLETEKDGSLRVLSALNSIVSSKADVEEPIDIKVSVDDDSFEEIDLMINSQIALNKKYKIDNKIKVALVKQNHLLMEQLKDYEGNDGFFQNKYVPFYNWVSENDHFDNFTYTVCFSTTADKYSKIIKSKIKDIQSFYSLSNQQIGICFGENEMLFNGKKQKVFCYYDSQKLLGMGKKNKDQMVGYWEVFYNNGAVQSKGVFDDEGEKTGKWFWLYENGKTKSEVVFEKGKLNGTYLQYFKGGGLNYSANYVDGEIDGEYKLYNERGALSAIKHFDKGTLDGEYKTFHDNGENYMDYFIPYKDGEINGLVKQYHLNGVESYQCNYVDGKKVGSEKQYHKNGQLISDVNYEAGIINGEYIVYLPDGKVKQKGTIENGDYIGHWEYFHNNGNLRLKSNYVKNELQGEYKEYDTDGVHYMTFEYKKGNLYSYSFFNKESKLIHTAKKKRGTLKYKGHHPNGNIKSEGLYDLKGGKEGLWKFYTKTGTLNSAGSYEEDLSDGKSTFYYPDGKEEVIQHYSNDTAVGYYLKQDRAGKILKQGWYKDGKVHGVWEAYYQDHTLKTKNFYNNGKSEGEQVSYDVLGKVATIFSYRNNVLKLERHYVDGLLYDSIVVPSNKKDIVKTHYTDGKINSEITYSYGQKNGKYVSYFHNGKISIAGQYLNNDKDGDWLWYHENGKVKYKYHYIEGEIDGEVIEYHKNGKNAITSTYIYGELHGKKKEYSKEGVLVAMMNFEYGVQQDARYFYSPEGKIQLIRYYNNNELIGYSYLDSSGKAVPVIPIKKETAKIVSYFDNGKKSREMEIVDGVFTGKYATYYYSGKKHREITYVNNEEEGEEMTYFSTGKVKKKENYSNGLLNGKVTNYHTNGKVKKVTNYVLGEKHGKSTSYSSRGAVTSIKKYYNDHLIFK